MTAKKLISVIVPVYNVEEYIDQCVISLLKQHYKLIEIILIDDGSTDKSGEKCDYYARNNHNIKVLHTKNNGVSRARNLGIQVASGEYIGFVDPDDYVDSKLYEVLYSLVEKNDSMLAAVRYDMVGDFPGYKLRKPTGREEILSSVEMLKSIILGNDCKKRYCSYAVWGKLYSIELIKKICFSEEIIYAEDALFNIKAIIQAEKVAYCNRALYHYRVRNNSASNSTIISDERIIAKIQSEKMQLDLLRKYSLDNLMMLKKIKICDDLYRIILDDNCNGVSKLINNFIIENEISIWQIIISDYSLMRKIKFIIIRLELHIKMWRRF